MQAPGAEKTRRESPPRPGSRRRRTKTVTICVSPAESQLVECHAAREQETSSAYVRRATLTRIASPNAHAVPEGLVEAEQRRELYAIRCAVKEIVDQLREGRDVDVLPVLRRLEGWMARAQGKSSHDPDPAL